VFGLLSVCGVARGCDVAMTEDDDISVQIRSSSV
jgi:hypothetical protein